MIENIKSVRNPLTIVAIFAALAEVAGIVALATLVGPLQTVFVWFVMGFPVLLLIAFFLTLNFNPRVLYAPSDFQDEDNFINTLMGTRRLVGDIETTAEQLDIAKSEIIE